MTLFHSVALAVGLYTLTVYPCYRGILAAGLDDES